MFRANNFKGTTVRGSMVEIIYVVLLSWARLESIIVDGRGTLFWEAWDGTLFQCPCIESFGPKGTEFENNLKFLSKCPGFPQWKQRIWFQGYVFWLFTCNLQNDLQVKICGPMKSSATSGAKYRFPHSTSFPWGLLRWLQKSSEGLWGKGAEKSLTNSYMP